MYKKEWITKDINQRCVLLQRVVDSVFDKLESIPKSYVEHILSFNINHISVVYFFKNYTNNIHYHKFVNSYLVFDDTETSFVCDALSYYHPMNRKFFSRMIKEQTQMVVGDDAYQVYNHFVDLDSYLFDDINQLSDMMNKRQEMEEHLTTPICIKLNSTQFRGCVAPTHYAKIAKYSANNIFNLPAIQFLADFYNDQYNYCQWYMLSEDKLLMYDSHNQTTKILTMMIPNTEDLYKETKRQEKIFYKQIKRMYY